MYGRPYGRPPFLKNIKKWKYGIVIARFFQKNGKMKLFYGNTKKPFFSKIW
jgi:hypothetical protein